MRRYLFCVLVAGSIGVLPARANDVDDGVEAPQHPAPPPANSPTWQQTIDNGDGTYTFQQQVDEASTPPHYTGPWSGYGFEIYSWYDGDYGWQHTFPDHNLPQLQILSTTLTIHAWDVDSEISHGWDGEFDGMSGDGVWLSPQYLQGYNNQWSTTVFNLDPSSLLDGNLDVTIDIDMHHSVRWWATTLDYSLMEVTYTFTENDPPYAPELAVSPVGCTYSNDDLLVAVTGPTPADPDGDSVNYEYRWLVDTGTGFYVDDEFAGRGDHSGGVVPAADTQYGDRWKVEVTAVDEHGAHGNANAVAFATIGQCNTPPIAHAGGDQTTCAVATLDGSGSYDPDGTIVDHKWELYSGGSWIGIGNTEVIEYDFGAVGSFQVRLTVTDDHGATDSANAYIEVTSVTCNLPPLAVCQDVTVSADANCKGNGSVDDGSSDPDGDPLTLTQAPAGPYGLGDTSVELTVSDDGGLSDVCSATVTVVDDTSPSITCPSDISAECDGADGIAASFSVVASDNCSVPSASCVDQDGNVVMSGDVFPIGITDVTCTANDGNGNTEACTFGVDVTSTSPSGLMLTGTPLVAGVGTPVSFTATFTDNAGDSHVAAWSFGDGDTALTDPAMSPVGESHSYAAQGIYTATVTVTDQCGNSVSDSVVVVVFDAADGFVTGGGWIIPSDGSYTEGLGNVDGNGKANFGFVVKYKKGADNPDGSLEFRYRNGNINLHSVLDKSDDFEWLVITSSQHIRFKGNGTVNGVENVTFKVTARDVGEPGAGNDTFKIEIWGGHDFDSENGSGAGGKHMISGTLGGGNIQIH